MLPESPNNTYRPQVRHANAAQNRLQTASCFPARQTHYTSFKQEDPAKKTGLKHHTLARLCLSIHLETNELLKRQKIRTILFASKRFPQFKKF